MLLCYFSSSFKWTRKQNVMFFFLIELVLYFKVFGLFFFIHLFLPAGRVLMMLGKAQFELQKFVDSYVNSFDTIVICKIVSQHTSSNPSCCLIYSLFFRLCFDWHSNKCFSFLLIAYKYYKYNHKPIGVTSEGTTSCRGLISLICFCQLHSIVIIVHSAFLIISKFQ